MATPGLLKITVFWNKGYDALISVDDVTNKVLWHDSNYIVDVFMWPTFGDSSISMREVITTSILKEFGEKNRPFWRVVLVQVQELGTGINYKLEALHQCGKKVKTKSQKVLGANSYVCGSYRGKTSTGGGLFGPPSRIGLNR